MVSAVKILYSSSLRVLTTIMMFLFLIRACQPVEMETIFVITTGDIQYIEGLSYRFYGNVTGLGKDEISEHGFCWSESANPDLNGPSSKLGPCTSSGDFHNTVSGLSAETTYYVKTYAVVNSLAIYGNEISFTTGWSPENTLMDVDGNLYKVVQIGDQTWMAQDLKVTRYADEVPIPNVKDSYVWYNFNEDSKAYCYYNNLLSNKITYGALYTWPAAVGGMEGSDLNPSGIQGVCPDGWHVPSDTEWKQLEMYLGMTPEDADKENWRGTGIGDKMKREGITFWKSPNSEANNETGFDALPGGYRHGSAEFHDLGTTARFWSSSSNGYGWFRRLDYDNSAIYRSSSGYYRGHAVRCVKDE